MKEHKTAFGGHERVHSAPLRESPPNHLTQRRRGGVALPSGLPAGLTRKGTKAASGGHETVPCLPWLNASPRPSCPAKRAFVSFRVRPSGHRRGRRRFRRNHPTRPRAKTAAPDTKHQEPFLLCLLWQLPPPPSAKGEWGRRRRPITPGCARSRGFELFRDNLNG